MGIDSIFYSMIKNTNKNAGSAESNESKHLLFLVYNVINCLRSIKYEMPRCMKIDILSIRFQE